MREFLAWIVEQMCRPLDTVVCEVANIDDDADYRYRAR